MGFLASEEARAINGNVVMADAGAALHLCRKIPGFAVYNR